MNRTKDDRMNIVMEMLNESEDSELINWLEYIDYFDAPAARSHHGNYPGGLADHSIEVAKQLRKLTIGLNLEWDRERSPEIVGIFHDVCKTDDYSYDWNADEPEISYNKNQFFKGHGDKSVIMLSSHIQLTDEERMCILFHMGAFADKEQWQYYSKAVHDYPNVLYTHTADMIVSQIIGM